MPALPKHVEAIVIFCNYTQHLPTCLSTCLRASQPDLKVVSLSHYLWVFGLLTGKLTPESNQGKLWDNRQISGMQSGILLHNSIQSQIISGFIHYVDS